MLKKIILIAGGALLSFQASAVAIVSNTSTVPGTAFNTVALTGFSTFSSQMVGSLVSVTFADGSNSSATWAAAGATGTGFSLTLAGDSFGSNWTLTNTSDSKGIVGFSFDGRPGNTVFDILPSNPVSPGSASGRAFSSVNGPDTISLAQGVYSDTLAVDGTFYGDLYLKLAVSFTGALGSDQSLTFLADTDNADVAKGGITPAIPEPETYALMLAGLALVGAVARKRRAQA